ncbi:MAG: DNA mismatch repair endonuclease MutL [Planctomycetes bacterium]|nr:DNA mismatch repair endonuclease MutL [Planctomycetota bacterium]
MARIKKLAPRLIDKIAAGEVVDGPASIVKELVENSIDAGASRIEITLEGGGTRRIRITDDGQGIAAEDLRLAVTSHATSKIRSVDDLFRIDSLGFRGEALASIAAVSHLRIASRAEGEPGAELRVDGGRMGRARGVGLPQGTTLEIGDLFYNVPARREFLRTQRGELRRIVSELKQQALCRPEIHFRVTHEGKTVLEAPHADEPRERLAQLLGRELAEDLGCLPRQEREGITIRGYFSPCDRSRGDSRQQLFFLNNRCIRDVTLLSAVKQAYANLLPPRRHPIVLLWLEIDPSAIDVNVHPRKSEVRFQADRLVFSMVVRSIQDSLRERGLVGDLRLPRYSAAAPTLSAAPPSGGAGEAGEASQPLTLPFGQPGSQEGPGRAPFPTGRFFQLHRRYLVEQSEAGLQLVDPHALHERILYEEIMERFRREPLESQRFLFPLVLEAGPEERLALAERGRPWPSWGFGSSLSRTTRSRSTRLHACSRLAE